MKADVCGVLIERAEQPADPPVGAGLLAGAGVGVINDLADTVRRRVSAGRRFEPDAPTNAVYAEYYAAYRELYPAVQPVAARLAETRRRGGQ